MVKELEKFETLKGTEVKKVEADDGSIRYFADGEQISQQSYAGHSSQRKDRIADVEQFRTSDHRWQKEFLADGTVRYRKDGLFTGENNYEHAKVWAHTEVVYPDPETGEIQTTIVEAHEASAMGVVANNPKEGETFEIITLDGDTIEVSQEELAEMFREAEEAEFRTPVHYLP